MDTKDIVVVSATFDFLKGKLSFICQMKEQTPTVFFITCPISNRNAVFTINHPVAISENPRLKVPKQNFFDQWIEDMKKFIEKELSNAGFDPYIEIDWETY